MNYDTMEAGREMDALVAEKVMGLPKASSLGKDSRCPITGGEMRMGIDRAWCFDCRTWHYGPHKEYSADISAAWEVVDRMEQSGKWLKLHSPWRPEDGDKWWADFLDHGFTGWNGKENPAEAPTAPLAICRAALKAAGKE